MFKISRQNAILSGLKRYYTGMPCKRGHLSERYVKSSDCISCIPNNYVKINTAIENIKKGNKLLKEFS